MPDKAEITSETVTEVATAKEVEQAAVPAPAADTSQKEGNRKEGSKVKGADLAMLVYRRRWYDPAQFRCPTCGGVVNATLLSQRGEVALACTSAKCKFADNAWGSWRAHKAE